MAWGNTQLAGLHGVGYDDGSGYGYGYGSGDGSGDGVGVGYGDGSGDGDGCGEILKVSKPKSESEKP